MKRIIAAILAALMCLACSSVMFSAPTAEEASPRLSVPVCGAEVSEAPLSVEAAPVAAEDVPEPVEESTEGPPAAYEMLCSEEDIATAAQMLYGEYGSDYVPYHEKAKCVCVALNRLGDHRFNAYGSTLAEQIRYPAQFAGWSPNNPITDELWEIAYDVCYRWSTIQQGAEGVKWETDCLFFYGDGQWNYFY